MSLKILYHHRTHARGAEGIHIRSIVNALEQLGHSVDILSVPGVEHNDKIVGAPVDKSKEKVKGLNKLWSYMSNSMPGFLFEIAEILYNFPAYIRLNKVLKEGDYDLIYERYAFFLIVGAVLAKKHNIPFVLEANEVNGIKGRARKQYFKFLSIIFEKKLFKLSTRIITVSSFLKGLIEQRLSNSTHNTQIVVAPNAIDLKNIPLKNKLDELLNKYSISKEQKIIGFAGWFDDWDRLDVFVRLISDLRSKEQDVVGLLIGDGVGVDDAKELSKKLNISESVIFTGAVSRDYIYKHLSLLDIAVFPHSNEFGSPVVMFEFMALNIPIVAPKLLPIMDVLTHKKNSMLFDVLDEKKLFEYVEILLNDASKSDELSKNAFTLIKNKHTWLNNASLITEVIND